MTILKATMEANLKAHSHLMRLAGGFVTCQGFFKHFFVVQDQQINMVCDSINMIHWGHLE